MKLYALVATLIALLTLPALAAEPYKDATLKLQLEAPADFAKTETKPELPETLGDLKVAFVDKNGEKSGGQLLIHHMNLPGGVDYNGFKTSVPESVNDFLNGKAKFVRQEDVEVGKFAGFMVEFEAPGDGRLPSPDGTIPHRVRWYLLKDGDSKLVGLVYHSREEAWKELEPKFTASLKTVKKVE